MRAVVSLLLMAVVWSAGQSVPRCGCKDEKEKPSNQRLLLTDKEKGDAEKSHSPWGIPRAGAGATNERLLHQEQYIIGYDDDLRVPLWVAYRLTRQGAAAKGKRLDCFRRDIRLSDEAAALCEDYPKGLFRRGHLAPYADMKQPESAGINTFIFSNMTPQYQKFNGVIWERLEGYVRKWAKVKGEIYVITGAVFDRNDDGQRDPDERAERVPPRRRVAIPTHFYKIVAHKQPSGFIEIISILLPHTRASITGDRGVAYLRQHIVSVDEIEELTGIDFFPELEEARQTALEKSRASNLWPTN